MADQRPLTMQVRWLLAPLAVSIAASAAAEPVRVNVPSGRAADVAIAIARQTGSSIVLSDRSLANRNVPAINGTMEPAEAVRRFANAIGAQAVRAGSSGWRLVAGRTQNAHPAGRPQEPQPASNLPSVPQVVVGAPIVVVASKRDLALDEFAGQVEILDGKELEFGGVGGTEKLLQRSSNVSSTHLGSGRNKLFIRGIADSSFTGPTQSTVGQYLGDLRLSYNAPDPDLRLSDMQRVEVLEGPQGTLYGAGSLGGIIRLVPNMPEMGVVYGSAAVGGTVTQHGAPGVDGSATLNLPLFGSDAAALRFTVDATSEGGYIDKPLIEKNDVNRTQILGGKAILRIDLGPDWTADLIAIGQQTDAADSQYADRDGEPLSRDTFVTEGSDAEFLHGQFVVSGRLGDLRLRSTTGTSWQKLAERYDATEPEGAPRLFEQRNHTQMIAHETRLWQPLETAEDGAFGWVAGFSYTHNSMRLNRNLGVESAMIARTGVRNTVDEFTGYGEASLRLLGGLIGTVGARYTHSRLGGEGEDVLPALAMLRDGVTAKRESGVFLPSASLLAQIDDGASVYFRYQEGFRPGGLAIEGDYVRAFRDDHTTTFEMGSRYASAQGDYELNASASFTRWTDIQADFIDRYGFPSTANIGDGRVWTATLSGRVDLSEALSLSGALTYNDSRVDEPSALIVADMWAPSFENGKLTADRPENLPSSMQVTRAEAWDVLAMRSMQVPNIARFAGRIAFDYQRPISPALDLTMRGWAGYVGKSRLGIGPDLGDLQGDYIDSGLTARVGNSRYGVSLGVTNIGDVIGNRFALGTPFAVGREQITPLRPRSVRLGFDAAF